MQVRSKVGAKFRIFDPLPKVRRAGGEICRDYSCYASVLSAGILFSQ